MQAQQHHGTDDFVAYSGPGCEEESWSPEVLSFYGDGETVLRKMGNFEMQLPRRRIYMFLLETVGGAELMLYEKQENNQYAVHRWSGEATGSLKEDINNAILANRGIACVGEQTKAIVGRIAELRAEGTIPAPVSARAAFGHPVLRHRTDYIRTTVYLLC